MPLLNKLFKKTGEGKKKEVKKPAVKKEPVKAVGGKKPETEIKKEAVLTSKVLVSPHMAEKAMAAQRLNQYVFKVGDKANKIIVANELKKNYNVKVLKVNIINVPKKARRVGKSQGFKAGYKKAIITLAAGQSIEFKQ
ncbi:50S ribosomal protein L23 [Candidatus Azambacteria bacterium]|nr:50S ribosomal protein L23 [Candidatus Azambacteria bacterium]